MICSSPYQDALQTVELRIATMPFALQQIGGKLKIRHQGVLAQAQKKLYECGGVGELLGVASQFAQFSEVNPEYGKALGWIDPKKTFKGIIESHDIPFKFLRTQEAYDKWQAGIDEKEEAMAAQQAAAMNEQALLQNAKNLRAPLKTLEKSKGV